MGIVPSEDEQTYLGTSSVEHFKKRVVWLVSLAAVGLISGVIIFFNAEFISITLFDTSNFADLIKYLAFILPVISLNRILYGVINGLSDYKAHAKIGLIGYLLTSISLLIFLYFFNLKGVLFSIILSPILFLQYSL